MADWLFWGVAVALAAGSLGLVLAPALRGRGRAARRASYDMQVFRDQLREIDADLARGALSPREAEATRLEVSRRLLAAADAEAAEHEAGRAPRAVRAWAAAAGTAALALTAGLYLALGAPGLPDDPLQPRLAREAAERASRMGQVEAEARVAANQPPVAPEGEDAALIARLQDVLADRPDDLEGHRLLARSLAASGRWAEARAAQDRVLAILGDQASATDLVDAAELGVLAAGGYVSPETETALAKALERDPANPVGRYYSGLTLLQAGRPDLAYRLWSGLLAEGPPDAPWIAPIRSAIDDVARQAGMPPPDATPPDSTQPDSPQPGPSQADVDAAAGMAPADRQAMIEGMVSQLSDRLASEGGPPDDWARLIRSLAVLGRDDEAATVLAEARAAHAADPAALATIDAAAAQAGLAP